MQVPFVMDLEASGLGRGSYPIEIGFVTPDERSYCTLIKPIEQWTHWDESAENLHHISRSILYEKGKDITEVAEWLNELLKGETVYSDGWANDMSWLGLLFNEAGVIQQFRIESILTLLGEEEREHWSTVHSAVVASNEVLRHRASSDAYMIQKTFRIIKCASQNGTCLVSEIKIS